MPKTSLRGFLWFAAVTIPAVGIWLSGQTIRATPEKIGHIRAKCAALDELRSMAGGHASTQSAQQALNDLSSHEAPPLRHIVAELLPDDAPEIREQESEPLQDGWTVRRTELLWNRVRLDAMARLVGALESERPPWRLRECLISSTGQEPGFGRVTLQLEALHKESI